MSSVVVVASYPGGLEERYFCNPESPHPRDRERDLLLDFSAVSSAMHWSSTDELGRPMTSAFLLLKRGRSRAGPYREEERCLPFASSLDDTRLAWRATPYPGWSTPFAGRLRLSMRLFRRDPFDFLFDGRLVSFLENLSGYLFVFGSTSSSNLQTSDGDFSVDLSNLIKIIIPVVPLSVLKSTVARE